MSMFMFSACQISVRHRMSGLLSSSSMRSLNFWMLAGRDLTFRLKILKFVSLLSCSSVAYLHSEMF